MNNPIRTTRRAAVLGGLVSAALAATIPAAVAAGAAAQPDSDVFAAFATWAAASNAYEASEAGDNDPLAVALTSAEQHLMSLSPVTARGMALMVLVHTSFGGGGVEDTGYGTSIMERLYAAVAPDDMALVNDWQREWRGSL